MNIDLGALAFFGSLALALALNFYCLFVAGFGSIAPLAL